MRRSLFAVFAAALASGFVLASALAGSSFTDAAGDATGNAPDITAVQVSNDNGGQILFDVTVSNLTPESALFLPIDIDKNATTGDNGDEYALEWYSSATAADNGWTIERWDGTNWVHPDSHPTMRGSLTATGVEFSINASDLGGTSGFAIYVGTARYAADEMVGFDRAPDGVAKWTYDLTKPTSPPATANPAPTVVKPVFGAILTIPAKPVAGKRFTYGIKVTRSDTGAPLTKGTMVCDPSIAGRVLPHAEQFKQGVAAMTFLVPRTAKGRQLRIKVKIVSGNQSTTKVVTYKVS